MHARIRVYYVEIQSISLTLEKKKKIRKKKRGTTEYLLGFVEPSLLDPV